MKLKKGIEDIVICNIMESLENDQFWYDLKHNHYIHPENLLDNEEDIKKVQNAIRLINEFESRLHRLKFYKRGDGK